MANKYAPEFEEKKVVVSNGERVEDLLSTGNPDKEINKNSWVEAIYLATLCGPNNKQIRIGFKAETDGIWRRDETRSSATNDGIQKNELVEVKCLTSDVFIEKSTNQPKFYNEEHVLREIWAQCRLRGIDKLLCGIVDESIKDNQVLTEIWLLNIDEIPRIINAKLPNDREFKRCFPTVKFCQMNKQKEIYVEMCREHHSKGGWKKWTEQQELALFDSLIFIEDSFDLDSKEESKISKTIEQIKYFAFSKDKLKEISIDEFENLVKTLEVTVKKNRANLSVETIRKRILSTIRLNQKEYPKLSQPPTASSVPFNKRVNSFKLEFETESKKDEFWKAWKETSFEDKKKLNVIVAIHFPNIE